MRIYKTDKKFIAMNSQGKYVYSAHRNGESEAKEKCLSMIKK